ncbi:MAG: molybdenum cofactor biosynthesis protein C [Acidobacteria bacterium RIFCSPLOWO2_12_FULL_54_10]|nr:MAG: molybdenum cofactor biosynthesis protein C [Acidobacteria bacterium RIFCSPLOWO2_12_FULL_54_10]
MAEFSHFGKDGSAKMVDVTSKPATSRRARAQGFVMMSRDVIKSLPRNPKGNPLEIARIAGITAAKQTAALIPLCHPLPLTHVDVDIRVESKGLRVESTVATRAVTGVEMEALTAVSVAALTIYDMCKAVDKSMVITDICLLEKSGGKSGRYVREVKKRGRKHDGA